MNSVYDCAKPFLMVAGIFGIGGSTICEIEGVRSVRNTKFSLIIAVFISLFVMPAYFITYTNRLFSDEQRSIFHSTTLIIQSGQYAFVLFTMAVTCIRTHVYCKNLTKVLQILNNTDIMLKQENIPVNYWRIILKTILFGLISCNYRNLYISVYVALYVSHGPITTGKYILKLFIDMACEYYFILIILFILIIRERFVGLNKLLLQNAQVSSIRQDNSLLRRISTARDIHEQLSEAIELFSDISRFILIGMLVPSTLQSIYNAIRTAKHWTESTGEEDYMTFYTLLMYSYFVAFPIVKIITLTAVCETHKNNRRVLTARLRYLISREEDPRTVQQLKQYIWFNYDTIAGLFDFQLIDIDFTLLLMVIDIIVQYVYVIYSYYR